MQTVCAVCIMYAWGLLCAYVSLKIDFQHFRVSLLSMCAFVSVGVLAAYGVCLRVFYVSGW